MTKAQIDTWIETGIYQPSESIKIDGDLSGVGMRKCLRILITSEEFCTPCGAGEFCTDVTCSGHGFLMPEYG